jgi:hypothetical protein
MKIFVPFALFVFLVGAFAGAAQAPGPLPSEILDKIPQMMRDKIPMYSVNVAIMKATLYNTDLKGKPLPQLGNTIPQTPKILADVPIGHYTYPNTPSPLREDQPYVAINPVNQKFMITVSHSGNNCVAYRSTDSGATWSQGIAMPIRTTLAGSVCIDPVVAYSPDGKRVYCSYVNFLYEFDQWVEDDGYRNWLWDYYMEDMSILVSHSDDNGLTWSDPMVALAGDPSHITQVYDLAWPSGWTVLDFYFGFEYDKPWLATSSFDTRQSNYVYVTATRWDMSGDWLFDSLFQNLPGIVFTRSADKGVMFDSPTLLEAGGYDPNPGAYYVDVQGARPVSGVGPGVVVAWYHLGIGSGGGFDIHAAYSPDNGASFHPVVVAAHDRNELPFYLGPYASFHWWRDAMFPSVAMDGGNNLHLAYTASPVTFDNTWDWSSAEAGDIRYVSSKAPYTSFTTPITVNQDGLATAQGYAAIAAEKQGTVHITWEDHRVSPNLDNSLYETYWARKLPGAVTFSKEQRVSDTPSLSSSLSIGDNTGVAVGKTILFTVWTDRRVDTSKDNFNNDVYGSRIIPQK